MTKHGTPNGFNPHTCWGDGWTTKNLTNWDAHAAMPKVVNPEPITAQGLRRKERKGK